MTAPFNPADRRRLRTVVVVASLVLAAAGTTLLITERPRELSTTRGVTVTLHVPDGFPGPILASPSSLWVSTSGTNPDPNVIPPGRLLQIDPATGTVRWTLQLPGEASDLVRYGEHVIVDSGKAGTYDNVLSAPGQLLVMDARTGHVLARRREATLPGPLAVGGGRLWEALFKPAMLEQLDPNTLRPAARPLLLTRTSVVGLAWGVGYLWAAAYDDGDVLRIDPAAETVTRIVVGGHPNAITVSGGSLWILDNAHTTLVRLDPITLKEIGRPVHTPAGGAADLAGNDGYVFVANQLDGTVTRVDERTGRIAGAPIRVAPPSSTFAALAVDALAPTGAAIWATSQTTHSVSRIQAR